MQKEFKTLIKKIQIKFGVNISSVKELKLLQKDIVMMTEKEISYSTLRRLFGFLPFSKPNSNTLNTLANYLGYKDYFIFRKTETFQSWDIWLYINRLKRKEKLSTTDRQFLIDLQLHPNFSLYFLHIITYYIYKKNSVALQQIFDKDILDISWTEVLKISNAIGLIIRDLYESDREVLLGLIENKVFRIKFFYNFIDYDMINTVYLDLLEKALLAEPQKRYTIFVELMLGYCKVLNGSQQEIQMPEVEAKDFKKLHPIVKGRFYAYELFSKKEEELETEIYTILELGKKEPKSLFFFEIIPVLMLLKRIDLIRLIYDAYYEDIFEVGAFQTFTRQSLFQIGLALVSLKEGKKIQALRELNMVNFDAIMDSYLSYVRIFYLLAKYHIVQENKERKAIEREFVELVEKTGFQYFSIEFLKGY